MNSNKVILFVLTVSLGGCSFPSFSFLPQRSQKLPVSASVTIAGETFNLEVAKTPQERSIGLMGRDSLSFDRGMLFQYSSSANRSFWMKNTKIPLDILFLNSGVVGSFYSNVPPCKKDPCPSYFSSVKADQVIELPGGSLNKLGYRLGVPIEVKYFK